VDEFSLLVAPAYGSGGGGEVAGESNSSSLTARCLSAFFQMTWDNYVVSLL
jgi:hypothetical protein